MKRILTLVLAATFVLGSVCSAQAVDIKASGTFDFGFGWVKGKDFMSKANNKHSGADSFRAVQRARTQVNFIASEQLQGVLMFEIGNINWGRKSEGGELDADGKNVETKRAYLDWMIPQTDVSVRMGIQGIDLPSATGFGNPVLSSDVAGIVVSAPVNDMFAVTALWARPFDSLEKDGKHNIADEMDVFALILPITGEGWKVTPWAAYSNIGSGSNFVDYVVTYNSDYAKDVEFGGDGARSNAWWAGFGTNIDMFDPLTFSFDVMYGSMNTLNFLQDDVNKRMSTRGWLIDAALDYKLDWGTPGIFGWYSTGDDYNDVKDHDRYGRMPAIGFDGGFGPTTFGSAGSNGNVGTDSVIGGTMLGTWGVGVQIADMSFVEKLSHTLRVTYYQGTNDDRVAKNGKALPLSAESIYLSEKDKALEINFDHQYQLYDNMKLCFEAGWIHLWLDEDVWGDANNSNGFQSNFGNHKASNAWKTELFFQYAF